MTFGPGSGPIHLNRLGCTGNEARLVDCPSGSISTCSHVHDVGVRCHVQATGRLARIELIILYDFLV